MSETAIGNFTEKTSVKFSVFSKMKNYLLLHSEITVVEREHVEKINRLALKVCLLHIPVFMLVAWICDTGKTGGSPPAPHYR